MKSPLQSNTQYDEKGFIHEQNIIIDKIQRCCLGHAKRPLVLTADRGRGKSTSLAIATAKLVTNHDKKYYNYWHQVEVNYQYFFYISIEYWGKTDKKQRSSSHLRFIPIDRLISKPDNCDLLIIDEAGSVPIQLPK